MNEDNKVESAAPQEAIKPKPNFKKKRDIFRFAGEKDMSINLDHVYKIVKEGKRVTFQTGGSLGSSHMADFVEFENDEAATKGYEQIIGLWSADVLE